ncbi:hypothetical protein [Sinorhizobium fredii]|uniref:hypothetical protein n=1 Tax=Rhizobium fredii TaxID=380 RepID=UPI0035199786
MTLWIESFADRLLSVTDTKQLPFKQRMALLKKGWTTAAIKRAALELAFRLDAARGNWVEPSTGLMSSNVAECMTDLRRRLAPFILPELAHIPMAFNVDARTVAEFAGAEFTPSVSEFARERLREWRSTYLDFPEGTTVLEDGWFARAVIISQESSAISKWSAIIQRAPDKKVMTLTWYVTENEGHYLASLLGCDDDFPHFASCSQWSEFIANLVYLCVTWFGTATRADHSAAFSGDQCQAAVDRDSQMVVTALAKPSRFRLVTLMPPGTRPLTTQQAMSGKKLLKHIRVRGHFKLVRYGKRWAHHRLQWVNSYEKGPRHQPLETRVALFKIEAAAATSNAI